MKPVNQEDDFGCAVACVAFILQTTYQEALSHFKDGSARVKNQANFYCPEIVSILNNSGRKYSWLRLTSRLNDFVIENSSIVFLRRSNQLPYGHFLVKHEDGWMDPWINLPMNPRTSGFRKKLPGEITHLISPK